MHYLVLDIGGTWIKGALIDGAQRPGEIRRVQAPASSALLETLLHFARECTQGHNLQSVVISTAGVVHSSGTHIVLCSDHLAFLRTPSWRDELEAALSCPVRLINDGEAFLLGAAELGYVPRVGTLCCLVIGTGLGCAISKDGRSWKPQGAPPLLGSIRMAGTSYDSLVSASRLAAKAPGGDLIHCLTAPEYQGAREEYFANLAEVTLTANILYGADHVLYGGGLCDAAAHAGVDIVAEVSRHWNGAPPPEVAQWPKLKVMKEGNAAQLIGAAALARGTTLQKLKNEAAYLGLVTEGVYPGTEKLHEKSPREVMEMLWKAEDAAGRDLQRSLDALAEVAAHVIQRWPSGGRLIYVGAGTSGRVAVLDALEIPCTYGYSPDRVVGVVAGGIAEASLKIETEGEEDHSSVPDMILLRPGPTDTVVGISASGSAYFVRSALEYAKSQGATTVMLQVDPTDMSEWDWAISLQSGAEVVAGSTRMKAGTATKKLLNFLTTTVMIGSGKVCGPYMIDMACLNAKLLIRARYILQQLFALLPEEAQDVLEKNDFSLKRAIDAHQERYNFK